MMPNNNIARENGVVLLALGLSVQSMLGLNLPDLDGGGICGLSELLILDEIINHIKHDLCLSEVPRPCECLPQPIVVQLVG